jgi:hypothetical protein
LDFAIFILFILLADITGIHLQCPLGLQFVCEADFRL